MKPLIGAPFAAPAVHETMAVEALLEEAATEVGGLGRLRTVTWTVPSTSRPPSPVLSPTR